MYVRRKQPHSDLTLPVNMFESDAAGQGGEVGGGWGDNIMRADLNDRPQLRGGQVQHGDVACADSQGGK